MIRTFLSIFIAILALSETATASTQDDYDAIAERIKPVGDIYLAEKNLVHPKPIGPREGTTVYSTFCVACHATGVNNAPIKGDAKAWNLRIAKGKEILLNHALNGFKGMPPRGTCMDCSDDEISAAINHMIKGL